MISWTSLVSDRTCISTSARAEHIWRLLRSVYVFFIRGFQQRWVRASGFGDLFWRGCGKGLIVGRRVEDGGELCAQVVFTPK
jgi:hypothetical protein